MTRKLPKMERIETIVHAAVDEFLEKGFEKASMESIARRGGISKGCIYHHFRGKDEIFLYAAQYLSQPVTRMMAAAESVPSAREGLRQYIHHYLRYWKAHHQELVFFFLSFTKVLEQPRLWTMYEEYAERMFDFFQKLLQRGIDAGEFPAHAARERGVALMSALDGVIGYVMLDRKLRVNDIEAEFARLFLTPAGQADPSKKARRHHGRSG
jgi:AcrR family transcriptional regulator